jgi:hypothetical protein
MPSAIVDDSAVHDDSAAVAFAPRLGKRVGAARDNGNDLCRRRRGLDPARDATRQRAIAERNDDCIPGIAAREQLDADRSGAFGDRRIESILDHRCAGSGGKLARALLGGIEIGSKQAHVRAERAHAVEFERIGGFGREYRQRDTVTTTEVSHRLAEISRARAHDRTAPRARQALRHEVARAAALERAQRIQRFDFQRELAPGKGGQWLGFKLGRVAKHRVDAARRLRDVLQRQPVTGPRRVK